MEDYIYGSVTGYIYDAFDRVLSETVWQGDEILAQTRYSYDDAVESQYNKVTKTVVGDANAPSIVTTQYTDKHGNVVMTGQLLNSVEYLDTYTFDYVGNVLTYLSAADEAKGYSYTAKYEYNGLGQVVKTYNALEQSTTTTYDMLGRTVRTTDYAGTPTTYTYDKLGRLISQTITIQSGVTATSEYEYDDAGNLTVEKTPVQTVGAAESHAKTVYTYNSRNRLTKVTQYNGNAVASTTTYTYDGVGNMLTTTVGGNTTTYTYDRFGNVLTMKDALGKTEYYNYSTLGRLDSKIDRNGVETSYGYDALGRVIYTTTDQGDTLQYVYTKTGQLLLEQSDDQLTQYSYDELGRVVEVTEYDQNEMEDLGLCLVRLNMNGESSIQQVRRGATITLPKLVRTGFTFNGWYNGDTLVSKGGVFRVTENCTLTAKWTVNRYTIAYDLNGGFLSGAQELTSQVCDYGTTVRLTSVIPSRTGYTFVGWGLSADAAVVYPSGAAVTNLTPQASEVITFYAIWSLDPADVPVPSVPTFPGDGEVNSVATVSTYAARSTTSSCGSTKTYAYDLAGNRTRFVLTKDGAAVHNIVYQYDVLNRLTKVYQNSTLCATYAYDVNGNRTKLSYPVTQTDTTYTYNKANWVTAVTSTANGTTLEHYAYSYYASNSRCSGFCDCNLFLHCICGNG